MTTAIYSKVKFDKQALLTGAIVALGVSFIVAILFGVTRVLSIVLAAQFIIFLLAFRRPVWAVACLIVGQFTTSSYMISILGTQVSVRFIWTVFALLLLIFIVWKNGGINFGRHARRVIIPAVIFFILVTVANIVNVDIQGTWDYLRQIASALVVLFLLPITVKNEKDLKLISVVALVTCGLSSLVAVMQHYGYYSGLPAPDLLGVGIFDGRVSGLTESDIHLAVNLPLVILPTVGILLINGIKANTKKFLILLVLLMGLALYFTFTRSGLYSLAPGLLAIILLIKSKAKKQILLVALVVSVIAFGVYVVHTGSRYSQGFTSEQSAAGRLVLWSASIKVAMDHPVFGVGPYKFREVSKEYAAYINPALMANVGAGSDLGNEAPHNDILNVWLSFGTLAMVAYLAVMTMIFINFFSSYRRSKRGFTQSFILGCIAALASYIVNALTHNVMDIVLFLWILAGLSIAADKIVSKQSQPVKELQ